MEGMSDFSDASIIRSINEGGRNLESAMSHLYLKHACRRQIFAFILKRKGSKEDAEDIFQDGIRFLIMQVRTNKYTGSGELGGYLFGICKNLWFKRFKRISREEDLSQVDTEAQADESNPELYMVEKDRSEQIKQFMSVLSPACIQVLQLWQLGYSMREIAVEMNYKTEGVVRKKKHLCVKKLMETLKKSPAWETWLRI